MIEMKVFFKIEFRTDKGKSKLPTSVTEIKREIEIVPSKEHLTYT